MNRTCGLKNDFAIIIHFIYIMYSNAAFRFFINVLVPFQANPYGKYSVKVLNEQGDEVALLDGYDPDDGMGTGQLGGGNVGIGAVASCCATGVARGVNESETGPREVTPGDECGAERA